MATVIDAVGEHVPLVPEMGDNKVPPLPVVYLYVQVLYVGAGYGKGRKALGSTWQLKTRKE